jgi:flagellar basal-body rod modification protein FlgD
MDVRHTSSITGVGSPAASAVASSLSPRPATTSKTTGTTKPMATSTTSSAAADSSDITSSDFLTLLVSELQNQDPTQPADPNAYITQLVQVNSLQQLIQINGDLDFVPTASTGTSSTSAATSSSQSVSGSGSDANSASNANDVAKAAELANVDSALNLQTAGNQNAMWGAPLSS